VIAKLHNRSEDAQQSFRTAAALGAPAALQNVTLKEILEGALFR
jgi:hypothetical protein